MQLILTGALIVIIFLLGLAVFLNNPRRPVNIAFSLFVFAVIGWTISNYLADHVRVLSVALFWVRASFAFTAALSALLLIFSYYFTNQEGKIARASMLLAAVTGILLFFFSFTPYLVKTVELKSWGANTINGPFFWVFPVYFAPTVIGAFALLVRQYPRAKGRQRQQIQYLFFGLALTFAFGTLTNLILPLMTGVTDLAKYGPFGTVFLIALTSWAIVQHRLLDIRFLVLKSVAYAFSFGIMIALYISATYLAFQELRLGISKAIVDIVAFFILVFTFNPIRLFIERITDRVFFKNRYDFNELLSKLTNITREHSRSVNALTTKTLAALTEDMRLTRAAFILTMSSQIARVQTLGYERKPRNVWGELMRLTIDSSGAVWVGDLADHSPEKALFRQFGIEVLLPVRSDIATYGAIVLGEKKSGDSFNEQDLELLELAGPPMSLALENAKSFAERGRRIAELKSINKMFQHIEHFLDLDKLLQEIVDEAISVTEADGGSLMLTHDGGHTLSIKTARNLSPIIALNTKVKVGEGIAGRVAKEQRPLVINGSAGEDYAPFLKRDDLASALSVPMIVEDKLIGVLNIHRKKNQHEFNEENLSIMSAFAAQAAEAIVKAGHYQQIENLSIQTDRQFREFTKALSRTVDAKDPYTYGHSEQVTRLCLAIADSLDLDEQETRTIEIGSRLHDMGKIGVPEAILNKPGKLTPEEMAIIRRHPEIAADILKDTESLDEIRELILHHHEKWDGSGYPAGLKGEEIPLGSRILSIADAYDAMLSHRAYRDPLPKHVAINELKRVSGTQFDPQIVESLLAVVGGVESGAIGKTGYRKSKLGQNQIREIKKRAA